MEDRDGGLGLARQLEQIVAAGDARAANADGVELRQPTDHGPTNYARPAALVLDDFVKAVRLSPEVNSSELTVTFQDGTLTVGGRLTDRRQRSALELLGASVLGVDDIDLSGLEVSKTGGPTHGGRAGHGTDAHHGQ